MVMIRHVHLYTENSDTLNVVFYAKYKNFIDDDYRFISEFTFDSLEMKMSSYSLKEPEQIYDTLLDDLLCLKKDFSKAITFSRTQEIADNEELMNVTNELLNTHNEYETNEAYL